mgnify:CR=1 FL=1
MAGLFPTWYCCSPLAQRVTGDTLIPEVGVYVTQRSELRQIRGDDLEGLLLLWKRLLLLREGSEAARRWKVLRVLVGVGHAPRTGVGPISLVAFLPPDPTLVALETSSPSPLAISPLSSSPFVSD